MFKIKTSYLKVLSTIVLLFVMATSALAAGESIRIDSFEIHNCTAGANADGVVTHTNGTLGVSIRFTLTNITQGTSETWTAGLLGSGTHTYSVPVPGLTTVGDAMQHTLEMIDGGGAVLVSDTLNYRCGVVASSNDPVAPEPQPAFADGRVNNWDTGNPVVLFPFTDGDSQGLNVYAANGDGLLLNILASTIDAVAECPDSNTLIVSDAASGISLWRLSRNSDGNCPFQLNAPTGEAGKIYSIVFNEMFAGTYYESWEE